MKPNIYISTLVCCMPLSMPSSDGATVQINWSTNPAYADLTNSTLTPLSHGTNAAGDGTILQLGYYSLATQSNPFVGSWVNLATSSMGDNGVELPGQFAVTTILSAGTFQAPAVGTPLAVRFFDGLSVLSSSYFNAVSVTSGAWNLVPAADPSPIVNIVIEKQNGIVFLGSAPSAFSTQVAIPEPTALLLVSTAGVLVCLGRRRRSLEVRSFTEGTL